MKHNALVVPLLVGLLLAPLAHADLFNLGSSSKEHAVEGAVAEKITATLKKIPEIGAAIGHIELIDGIRAMDDEIASAGELKILIDLNWQALASHPEERIALDNTAANIIAAVFSEHNAITKLRVIVKIPKSNGKYQSAAKVFSFTRATWELSKNDARFQLNNPTGAANLLALGDYVILTSQGWVRGY